ncbi:MAG: penicillin-binding protein 1C [Parvibaculaceae bacterium]
MSERDDIGGAAPRRPGARGRAPSRTGTTPRWIFAPFLAAVLLIAVAAGTRELDRAYPPPLANAAPVSVEVRDRNGELLRAFATPAGRWRLNADLDQIDPRFVRMLIAYEDRRFWNHHGIDPLAMLRAAGQLLRHGRIVSGGSTITMQVARLLEGPAPRSFGGKFAQMLRALQIEARLSKRQILELYLTLAPYGGNLEGVVAASHAWLGKSPRQLSPSEAALLVSLPQTPERRRPDRNPDVAHKARDRVFERMVYLGVLDAREIAAARLERLEPRRRDLPASAAHLALDVVRLKPEARPQRLTIDRQLQEKLEALAAERGKNLPDRLSLAMLLADHHTGDILASVGSPSVFDAGRWGEIDMTKARRSPGSTLKPFIYGLAFEQGLVLPETQIEDTPQDFSGYRPTNFDLTYQGTVTIRQALQLSLNVPAVALLEAVGPQRLLSRFDRAGVAAEMPKEGTPGLAIGLGGLGLSLRDLVGLYTALPRLGEAVPLSDGIARTTSEQSGAVLPEIPTWYVNDILLGTPPPDGARRSGIAYKTGTSYGYRDSWAIGYDGRYVLGVWVGRPDGTAVPGLTGRSHAAPLLFEAFARLPGRIAPLPKAPAGALRLRTAELPAALRRFTPPRRLVAVRNETRPPMIVHPPQGARIALGEEEGALSPLVLKIQGGRAPYRWLANGRPFPALERRRETRWLPDEAGASTLTVIDAEGRAATVTVYIQ